VGLVLLLSKKQYEDTKKAKSQIPLDVLAHQTWQLYQPNNNSSSIRQAPNYIWFIVA
jgi:hypothetical protein